RSCEKGPCSRGEEPASPKLWYPSGALESSALIPRLGQRLFHLRSFTPVPVIAALLLRLWQLAQRPDVDSGLGTTVTLIAGWALCFAGQALRFYTLGQVPEGTSGQGNQLEAVTLNTRGPYAYVRNPLYLGNLCICAGLLLLVRDPWAWLLGLGFFFGEYFF